MRCRKRSIRWGFEGGHTSSPHSAELPLKGKPLYTFRKCKNLIVTMYYGLAVIIFQPLTERLAQIKGSPRMVRFHRLPLRVERIVAFGINSSIRVSVSADGEKRRSWLAFLPPKILRFARE